MSITYDDEVDFDEEKWEAWLNSDEIFTEDFLNSPKTMDEASSDSFQNKDILKLSFNDYTRSSFLNSDQYIRSGRSLSILTPPSTYQRVRYENECKHIFRYISVPNNRNLTIAIPDLRNNLQINDALWIRITRTTINYRNDHLIFYHPYPIWIKNSQGKIHNGSIFIPITNQNIQDGFIQIDTLAMIRLKQEELKKISTLAVYSPAQLHPYGMHSIEIERAKRIRDEYHLRESILNFQLVRIDQNNVAYPTDCFCQTEPIHELEANDQQQQKMMEMKITKAKDFHRKKKNTPNQ